MSIIRLDHLKPTVHKNSVDVIGIDLFNWGGFSGAQLALRICDASKLDVFGHCFFDLGITTAANLHLAAASQTMVNGVDTCLYLQNHDVIVDGKFKVKDGCLSVPDAPGIGVELDESALAKVTTESVSLS